MSWTHHGAIGPVVPPSRVHDGPRRAPCRAGLGVQPGLPVRSRSLSFLSDSRWAVRVLENHRMALVGKRETAHTN